MDLSTRLRVLVQSPSPLLGGGAVARLAGLTPRPQPPPPPPTAAAWRLAVLAAGGRVPAIWELPTAAAAAAAAPARASPAARPPRERRPWTAPAPVPRLAAHRRADAFKPAPRGGGASPRRGPSDPPPVASSPRRPVPPPSSATRPPLPPAWSDEPSAGTFSAVTSPSMLSPDGRPSPPAPAAAATAAAPSTWSPPRSPLGGRDRWAWPPAVAPLPPATARRARPALPVPPVPPPSPVALPAATPPGLVAPGDGAAPTDGRDGGAEGGSPPRPSRRRASRSPTVFKCTHPGCNVVSRFRSYARTHARLHSSELPFVCPVDGCGRRFKWASSLGYHKRRHAALEKQAQELRAFCDNF